jgi:spore coat protein CotH
LQAHAGSPAKPPDAATSGRSSAGFDPMSSSTPAKTSAADAGAAQSSKRNTPPADDDAGVAEQANFSLSEPLQIALELSDSDWDTLRFQGRSLPATVSGCADTTFSSYTRFAAQLQLLGQTLPEVELRKKGYIGSISVFRPSLSIDFDKKRSVGGFKRLTLNNNIEDPSNAHQCMAYALFERAGLPAPRCGLASVTVNGVSKGFFTNVEPIKKPFLRRVFGEDAGNLYELQASADLIAEHADRLELKNDGATDRSDLMRLIATLQLPDAELITNLEPVLDLDEYLSFWALEALLGQWDGLSAHGTNSYLYHARSDDRFHAIPWGSDQAFTSIRDLLGDDGAVSVYAGIQLSKRLWALPEWRAKYQERLRKLLSELWHPDELIAQLHAIAVVTQANASAVATTEQFIQKQRELLEAELGQAEPPPARALAIPGACDPAKAASSGLYAVWDAAQRSGDNPLDQLALLTSARPVPSGMLALDIHVHERAITPLLGSLLGAAGVNAQGFAFLGLSFSDAMTRNTLLLAIVMPLANYHAGEIKFHGYETYGVLTELRQNERHILGYIGEGSIQLDLAGPQTGDVVQGSWNALLAAQPGE